jgi:hypothetical protein
MPRDSNNARLTHILQDPALRLLLGLVVVGSEFRDIQVERQVLLTQRIAKEFTEKQTQSGILKNSVNSFAIRCVRRTCLSTWMSRNSLPTTTRPRRSVRPWSCGWRGCCGARGRCSAHTVSREPKTRCTVHMGDDESMFKSLQEVVHLFELAQTSVFKLMSSDSVPVVDVQLTR